jgi:CDP-diacylglycerol--serine O-phosphatidyltransferase
MRRKAMLASAVTLGNALCGLLGCVALMRLDVWHERSIALAAACVFAGFVLDRLDGTLARRLGVDSPFGAQLDSLCDVLSFGLLPALLLIAPVPLNAVRMAIAMIYLASAIVRLSRFTLAATNAPGTDPMPRPIIDGHRHYHGLPSPAAAMVVASAVLLEAFGGRGAMFPLAALQPIALIGHRWFSIVMTIAAAMAMVQPWPYADPPAAFATGRWPRLLLAPLIAIGVVAGPFTAMSVFAAGYLATGPILSRRADAAVQPEPGPDGMKRAS